MKELQEHSVHLCTAAAFYESNRKAPQLSYLFDHQRDFFIFQWVIKVVFQTWEKSLDERPKVLVLATTKSIYVCLFSWRAKRIPPCP